jgi:hypothetical protein
MRSCVARPCRWTSEAVSGTGWLGKFGGIVGEERQRKREVGRAGCRRGVYTVSCGASVGIESKMVKAGKTCVGTAARVKLCTMVKVGRGLRVAHFIYNTYKAHTTHKGSLAAR